MVKGSSDPIQDLEDILEYISDIYEDYNPIQTTDIAFSQLKQDKKPFAAFFPEFQKYIIRMGYLQQVQMRRPVYHRNRRKEAIKVLQRW